MTESAIPVKPSDLRLWRDTLRSEQNGFTEGEPLFLHEPWPGTGVSLADRMIASMESYLIATDTDWPDGE